ncbi:sodium:proton antiporter [Leucobacter sp. NPDC077196]|uniref:cation:proton antiporter n=1 Tax=Leucobacter sp. NPDC077196 TaxID=3154959 RepID=UPI003412F8BD
MEIGLIAVAAVVVLVGTSILGSRIGVAAPLLLVVVGIGAGYLPFIPPVEIDPEIILIGVLPPLLYSAAVNVPLIDFRRNLRPVIGLSVLLVIISAVAIGFALHWLVPAIPLPAAVALGAVISPTDAVAATSIGKRLGMPERLVSILEGESLVNDATSLVLLKTALAAVAGSFVFWDAAGSFAFSAAAAIAIGLIIGVITVWVRSKLHNPVYDTIISFVVPFVAFMPAEALGASGVLAVVVTGLYTGHHAAKRFSATARMNERLNWRTVQFGLENGVFLVMGLQLHTLLDEVNETELQLEHIALVALGLVAILILLRGLFMIPLIWTMRGDKGRYQQRSDGFSRILTRARRADTTERRLRKLELLEQRSRADLAHEQEQQLGWRDGVLLSWSGMRGVVTLAAAQSISTDVPYRPQIILIAFAVAVVTLLLHGLTLPLFIAKLWPEGANGSRTAEMQSLGRDLLEAGNTALADEIEIDADGADGRILPDDDVVRRVRSTARSTLAPLTFPLTSTGAVQAQAQESQTACYRRLARTVLDAQRDALLEERAIGRYSSQALRAAELALDAQETRVTPPSAH